MNWREKVAGKILESHVLSVLFVATVAMVMAVTTALIVHFIVN